MTRAAMHPGGDVGNRAVRNILFSILKYVLHHILG